MLGGKQLEEYSKQFGSLAQKINEAHLKPFEYVEKLQQKMAQDTKEHQEAIIILNKKAEEERLHFLEVLNTIQANYEKQLQVVLGEAQKKDNVGDGFAIGTAGVVIVVSIIIGAASGNMTTSLITGFSIAGIAVSIQRPTGRYFYQSISNFTLKTTHAFKRALNYCWKPSTIPQPVADTYEVQIKSEELSNKLPNESAEPVQTTSTGMPGQTEEMESRLKITIEDLSVRQDQNMDGRGNKSVTSGMDSNNNTSQTGPLFFSSTHKSLNASNNVNSSPVQANFNPKKFKTKNRSGANAAA